MGGYKMKLYKSLGVFAVFMMSLAGCGETQHTHRPGEKVKENEVAATCVTSGHYDLVTYCLDCEEELSRERKTISPLGHDPIHVDAKDATCTEDGHNAYEYCSRCDYSTKVIIHATGHLHTETKNENVVPASCLLAGSYDLVTYCLDCNKEISRVAKTLPALGHDLHQVEAKPATCTENGHNAYEYCSRCDYSTMEVISATGHLHVETRNENVINADCLTSGSYDLVTYCLDCNKELSREAKTLAPLGHDIHQVEAKPASCTEDGHNAYEYCSRCEYSTMEVIHATGHLHTKTRNENEVPADCIHDGSYDLVTYCADCNSEISRESKTIPALGHDIHHEAAKEVTCTEDGYDEYEYCSRCDYSTQVIIHATGHRHLSTRNENVVEAGCESDGSYDLVTYCADCNEVINTEHKTVAALGHDYQLVSSTPATLDHDGYDTYECSRCHDTYDEKTEDQITDPIKYETGSYWNPTDGKTYSGYKVVGYYGEPEELIVPAKHEGKDVVYVESTAFQGCTSVKKIDIANNVAIGNWAFKGCSNLEELSVQYATTNITFAYSFTNSSIYAKTQFGTFFGEEEYENSYPIKQYWNWADSYNAYIPKSLKKLTIRSCVLFNACAGLTSLEEISVGTCGEWAFNGCSNLKKITFHNGATLYSDCFANCNNVETIICQGSITRYSSNLTASVIPAVDEIILEDSVTSIGYYAFYGLPMKTIRMSPNITSISSYAFYNNANLREIVIPENVETMGGYNFDSCASLKRFEYRATNMAFTFNPFNDYEQAPFKNTSLTEIYISSNVQSVEKYLFPSSPLVLTNLSSITEFTPTSKARYSFTEENQFTREMIDDCEVYTFGETKVLTDYLGDSETFEIPSYINDVFNLLKGNSIVKNLIVRNNIKTASDHFLSYSKVESLYLDVETIEPNAIMSCTRLNSVTFGTSLTTIKANAIYDCYYVKYVTYEGTKEQWNAIEKSATWYYFSITSVHCSDGNIPLS